MWYQIIDSVQCDLQKTPPLFIYFDYQGIFITGNCNQLLEKELFKNYRS